MTMKRFNADTFGRGRASRRGDKSMLGAGAMLVAHPQLTQSCFNHAVIVLLDYGRDSGAMGCVLNYSTNFGLNDILENVRYEGVPVFGGGPVGLDRLFFLHTLGEDILPGANVVTPGLWGGGDFDAVADYVNAGYTTEGELRFFLGYSGWEAGQLEDEIDEGTWATLRMPDDPSELLRGDGDAVWHNAVRALGKEYRDWQLYPRNIHSN